MLYLQFPSFHGNKDLNNVLVNGMYKKKIHSLIFLNGKKYV
jgi:hypothetical protein